MHASIQLHANDFGEGELLLISGSDALSRTLVTTEKTLASYPRDRFLSACVAYLRAEGFKVEVPGGIEE